MKIEIFKDSKCEFRFRIIARNGKIVASSEGYKIKNSAKKAIKCIIKGFNSPNFSISMVKDLTKKKNR